MTTDMDYRRLWFYLVVVRALYFLAIDSCLRHATLVSINARLLLVCNVAAFIHTVDVNDGVNVGDYFIVVYVHQLEGNSQLPPAR